MQAIAVPTLTDDAIRVRPPRPDDIPALVAACQDPEIPRWTRVPVPYVREDAERFLAIAASEARAGAGVALVIADAASDRLLGTVGLMDLDDERRSGEVGYWIAAADRGRGAATRAVVLLRDWAHAALGLEEVELLPHRDNRASQRVAERAGFTDSGAVRRMARMPEGRRDGYMVYVWRP